jgi:hypothetical protein
MPISLTLLSPTLSRRARGIWRDCCWQCRAAGCSFGGLTCSVCNTSGAPCRSTYDLRSVLIKPRSPVGRLACVQVRRTVRIYEDTEVGARARTQPQAVWTHFNIWWSTTSETFTKAQPFLYFPRIVIVAEELISYSLLICAIRIPCHSARFYTAVRGTFFVILSETLSCRTHLDLGNRY